jgi:hypothetical protein
LLPSIIDYAGLFPPAGLDMRAAVANYAAYRAGRHAWMLGRFIVPVDRLGEFESVVRAIAPADAAWRLSVLVGASIESDLAAIADFNRRNAPARSGAESGSIGCPRCNIDTIELKATRPDEITQPMRLVPHKLIAYIEVPISADESLLRAVRSAGARAKIRTGGVVPDAIPTCADLAGFLARAATVGVPLKATAGLHHPIRSVQRLTYADDSPRTMMHGFLNVFLAAAGVRAGMNANEAENLLEETSPTALQFDDHAASWRHHRWTRDHLQATRREFAISFGSCSFQEPIDDLKSMKLL